jgi:hypothetical protein
VKDRILFSSKPTSIGDSLRCADHKRIEFIEPPVIFFRMLNFSHAYRRLPISKSGIPFCVC